MTTPTPQGASSLPNTGYVALAVSGSSSNVALPQNTTTFNVLTIANTGMVDAYIAQGGSTITATNADVIVRAGTTITLIVTGTYVAAITASSTTNLDIFQANGPIELGAATTGSGGGGGGGGAVYGPTATGTASANPPVQIGGTTTGAAGANVQGAAVKPASTAPLATDSALVVSVSPNSNSALETGGNLATTATNTGTIAGAVTANVVQSNTKQVNGVTTLAGAGAVGTGAQRVAVGQDTSTIAGSAPGTAGTASANVLSVQGVASMTALQIAPSTTNKVSGAISVTSGSSTSLITAVASNRIYVTGYSLSNTSATTITVAFQDGNGGTTLWTQIVPAGSGANISGTEPLFWTTSGNGLFIAASTGESTVYANASGFSGS